MPGMTGYDLLRKIKVKKKKKQDPKPLCILLSIQQSFEDQYQNSQLELFPAQNHFNQAKIWAYTCIIGVVIVHE